MTALPPGWLVDQLPEVMASQPFTRNFLAIFEDVAGSLRARVDNVEHHVDARLAPPEDLGWLASWLAQPVEGLPAHRQRKVIAVAGQQLPWRGTARWLHALLAAYTGAAVEVRDTGGVYLPEHWRPHGRTVTVRLADTGGLSRHQLERLIRRELPVDADLDLHLPDDGPESAPAPDASPPTPTEHAEPHEPPSTHGEPFDAEASGWLPPQIGSWAKSPAEGQEVIDELFTAELECDSFTITPDYPLHCRLYLQNRSDQRDELTVVGVDESAEWLPGTPLIVPLAGGQQQEVPLEVVVPPGQGLQPGRYTIELRVTSYLPGQEPKILRLVLDLRDQK